MIETLTIPQELRDRPQWFLHIQKCPVNEDQSKASYTNEDYWSEYEAIAASLARGQYDGIGYVFSSDDPFVGVDLDGCRCPVTGRLADWATDIIEKLNSYTEISPSGTGVKIFIEGQSPFDKGRNIKLDNVEQISDKNPGFEIYDQARFFTVTGNHLEGTPTTVERSSGLNAICAKYVPKEELNPTASQSQGSRHEDEQHVIERARRYIGKISGAVSGNRGHDATFHVAGVLVVGFGLSNEDALPLIEEWNATCEPPWSEAELRHKIDDASKQSGPRNELRFSGDHNGNGQSQDNGIRQKPEYVTQKSGEQKPATEKVFAFHTATDFDRLNLHREYHIPGILAAGPVPAILAGSFKTLKTSIAMDLLISLATQHRFLDHFTITKRVRVAVMSGESGGFALQNLARRVAQSKGWSFSEIGEWFSICTSVLNLASSSDLQEIERFVVENEIGVFCIDPCYLAMRSLRADEACSLFAMGNLLEPLTKLAQRTGCTPLLIHHNTKSSMRNNIGEPAELADISWSGFSEWSAQWLLISRREKYDPDSNGEHALWLTAGGRDGHSTLVGVNVTEGRTDGSQGRHWDVEVVDAGKTRADAMEAVQGRKTKEHDSLKQNQADNDRDAILTVMQRMEEAETKTAIRDRCGMASRRFNSVFAELLGDKLLEMREITKGNGRRYDAYKLQQDATGRNGTSGCVPLQSHSSRTTPLKGGCPAPAALLPMDGSSNENENVRVCPDANGTGGDSF